MKKIILTNYSELSAEGKRQGKNCKPVICIDTGEVWASVSDLADSLGVSVTSASHVVTGKTKTCKGKHYCFVSNLAENFEEISARMRTLVYKASLYDEIAIKQAEIEKANKRLAEHKANCERLREQLEAETTRMMEMENAIATLTA